MKRQKLIKNLMLSAMCTAFTVVLTCFAKLPAANGYIHLGDAVIYLAACFLPKHFAVISAGLSGVLADTLSGYTIYILPTLIIKVLLVIAFNSGTKNILAKRNKLALIPASLITVIGYYIADAVIVGISSGNFGSIAFTAALYSIPSNIIQAIGSAVVFLTVAASLDKIRIKDMI